MSFVNGVHVQDQVTDVSGFHRLDMHFASVHHLQFAQGLRTTLIVSKMFVLEPMNVVYGASPQLVKLAVNALPLLPDTAKKLQIRTLAT